MFAGHTKNRFDGAFGFVKRKFRQRDVLTPRKMVDCVNDSSVSNIARTSDFTVWRNWKKFLSKYVTIPSEFKLSQYHVFAFSIKDVESVNVRFLSTDETSRKFRLLKSHVSVEQVREELKQLSSEELIHKLHLNPDRADVILPASRIYVAAMKAAGATKIKVPDIGLKDGIMKMLFEKHVKQISLLNSFF